MTIHYLKCRTDFFMASDMGMKTFELRRNDRGFQVYDIVVLQETIDGKKTGREITKEIAYILEGGIFGLDKNYCILQLRDENAV